MNLGDIRTNARDLLDESTASYWPDAQLNRFINRAYRYYWMWLIEQNVPGILKTTTLNIVADTATIALPSDFVKARLVERVFDSYTVPLRYFERYDTINRTDGTSVNDIIGYLPDYHFVGSNLVLEPTPSDSQTGGIKLTYYYIPTELSSDSDVPNPMLPSLYHDLLVYGCVMDAKRKEESVANTGADVGGFMSAKLELEQKFKESIEGTSVQRTSVEPYGIY